MAALKSIQQTTASTKGFNQKMLAQLEEEQRKQAEEEMNRQSAAQDVLRKYADDAERVASLLQNAKKEHREKIEKNRQEMRIRIKQKLEECLKLYGIEAEVCGRAKHIYSIWNKMQSKMIDYNAIYEIELHNKINIYQMIFKLRQQFDTFNKIFNDIKVSKTLTL